MEVDNKYPKLIHLLLPENAISVKFEHLLSVDIGSTNNNDYAYYDCIIELFLLI